MLTIPSTGLLSFGPDQMMVMDSRAQMRGADALGHFLDRFTPDRSLFVKDANPGTGGAWLQGELEKPDFNLIEPLSNFTWSRDLPYKTGGGFVDYVSNFYADYAAPGANQYGLMGVDTNNLPTVQANVTKDLFKVFRFGYLVNIPLISESRFASVGRSLQDLLQKGLRLNYDLMLNDSAYKGLAPVGTKGLLNQATSLDAQSDTAVYQHYAPAVGANSSRKWADKTPSQILDDFDGLLVSIWQNSKLAGNGGEGPMMMPNQVGLPELEFARLNRILISGAGNISLLTYLKENNIVASQGQPLNIVPMTQCNGAGDDLGSGATGRMVAYRNDIDCLNFEETVPLTRIMTAPVPQAVAYQSVYVASVSQLKILRFQTMGYLDGIS
jgi:hypothetical protein